MGLDQYFYAEPADEGELAYFRKANHLHRWVLATTDEQPESDNCTHIKITLGDLRNLVKQIDEILSLRESRKYKKAKELLVEYNLVPMGGFFFGSTEIDKNFWKELKEDRDTIDGMITQYYDSDDPDDTSLYYYAWY